MSKAATRVVQSDSHDSEDLTASTSFSKPKRVRTYLPRRPRTFPAGIRQKLSLLGHAPPSNDTSRENLGYLIDRLTSDLQNYRALAEHWQHKVVNLERTNGDESSSSSTEESTEGLVEQASNSFASSGCESCSCHLDSISACSSCTTKPNSPCSQAPDLLLGTPGEDSSSPRAMEDYSAFGTHLIGHLSATANPSLSLVQVSAPRLRSNVSSLITESTFRLVLAAVDNMAAQYLESAIEDNSWPMIRYLKPDFNPEKARSVWNRVFAPIDVHPAQIGYNAGSSCRRDSNHHSEDDSDSDSDELEKALAHATDVDVIDMLHYSSLLTGGMHQAVFDDPSLSAARLHLGRSSERLLREAIFTRNLTTNGQVAQVLLDGFVGTFLHFTTQGMTAAVVSILELSWMVLTQHPNLVHHSLQVFISFFSLVLAPSQSKRATWMQRGMAILERSKQDRCFQTILIGYFGAAYFGLLTQDEDLALSNIALMDEMLAPGPHHMSASEAWDVSCFHPILSASHRYNPPTALPQAPTEPFKPFEEEFRFDSLPESMLDDPTLDFWLPSSLPTDLPNDAPLAEASSTEYSQFLDEHGRAYSPGENLKSLLRISLQLLRAEASLTFQDEETCMYWVDEAEKTLRSIPLKYMFQRVLLLKNVITATCPFPTGTRSVVDEFERRMFELDNANCARRGVPPRDPRQIGALWRTP